MINPCGSSFSGPYYEVILYFFYFYKALHTFFFIFFRKLFTRLGGPEALDFFQSVHKARLIKYKFLGVKVKLGSRD